MSYPVGDVTCNTDSYNGTISCGNIELTVSVSLEEADDKCTLYMRIVENLLLSSEIPIEHTLSVSEVFSDIAFSFERVFSFSGDYISGEFILSETPIGFINTKFRGVCDERFRDEADEEFSARCLECKACQHCKCLPAFLCIGYVVESHCGTVVIWRKVEFKEEDQRWTEIFVIKNEFDEYDTREVTLDLCEHFLYDSDGYGITSESLFNICAVSLRVEEARYSSIEYMDIVPYRLFTADKFCIFDIQQTRLVRDIDAPEFVDDAPFIDRRYRERVIFQNGPCECPKSGRAVDFDGCDGACPDLIAHETPLEVDNGCYADPLHLTFIAPGYEFDGTIMNIAIHGAGGFNHSGSILAPPAEIPGLEYTCLTYWGQYTFACAQGYGTIITHPMSTRAYILFRFRLVFVSPCPGPFSEPAPSSYKLVYELHWAPGNMNILDIKGVLSPISAECDPPVFDFVMPGLGAISNDGPFPVTDPYCGSVEGEDFLVRITL